MISGTDIVVGIDLGTTALKAAAFGCRNGRALAVSGRRLAVRAGSGGAREQSASEIDTAFAETMADLSRKLGRQWSRVGGIGVAAQGGSAVICDRASGRARSPLVLWNDMRFQPHLPDVMASKPAVYWRERSWRDEPGWGLAKMLWMRKARPGLLESAGVLYAGAGDLLYHRLTGQWRQDAGNALQEGCFNVPRRALDPEPLLGVGATIDLVSPLREGDGLLPLTSAAAKRLGLAAGMPVAGPYMDHEAGYLAATLWVDRPMQLSLGTAWVGNFVLQADAKWQSPFQLVIPSPTDDGWLVVQPMLTGNVTWDWALSHLAGSTREQAVAHASKVFAERLVPQGGLVALPWFNMPNPLATDTMGGGAFVGMGPNTTLAEMLRAVAAGMVYETARVLAEPIRRKCVDAVVLSGGSSSAMHFRQLLAAVLSPMPVLVCGDDEPMGPRGAVRVFGGAKPGTRLARVRPPGQKSAAEIAKGFERYLKVFERFCGQVPAGGPLTFAGGR